MYYISNWSSFHIILTVFPMHYKLENMEYAYVWVCIFLYVYMCVHITGKGKECGHNFVNDILFKKQTEQAKCEKQESVLRIYSIPNMTQPCILSHLLFRISSVLSGGLS